MRRPGLSASRARSRAVTRTGRLAVALLLNLVLVGGLAYVAVSAHSLGVLAAGIDYLADAAAIALAVAALRRSARQPTANVVAVVVNAGWLLVLSVVVVAIGIDRIVARTGQVDGLPVVVMSAVAALVMSLAAVVLRVDFDADDDSGEALSHRAVLLDTVADAASALGVAGAGAVILATGGWFWLDPAVALAIAAVAAWRASVLLRKARACLRA